MLALWRNISWKRAASDQFFVPCRTVVLEDLAQSKHGAALGLPLPLTVGLGRQELQKI